MPRSILNFPTEFWNGYAKHATVLFPKLPWPRMVTRMPGHQPAPPLLRDFRAGETIFRENQHGESMFLVLSGSVRLSLSSMDVEDVEAGGFLGEMSLLQDEPRTTSAVANSDCSLQE